jgi:hypothetical protein
MGGDPASPIVGLDNIESTANPAKPSSSSPSMSFVTCQ